MDDSLIAPGGGHEPHQATCGVCHLLCDKQAVVASCGHRFCSLCLLPHVICPVASCRTTIEQSKSVPFKGVETARTYRVNLETLKSVESGVWPNHLLGVLPLDFSLLPTKVQRQACAMGLLKRTPGAGKSPQASDAGKHDLLSSAKAMQMRVVSVLDLVEVTSTRKVLASDHLIDSFALVGATPTMAVDNDKGLLEVEQHFRARVDALVKEMVEVELDTVGQGSAADDESDDDMKDMANRGLWQSKSKLDASLGGYPEYTGKLGVEVVVSVLDTSWKCEISPFNDARVNVTVSLGLGPSSFCQPADVADAKGVPITLGHAQRLHLVVRPQYALLTFAGELFVYSHLLGGVFRRCKPPVPPLKSKSVDEELKENNTEDAILSDQADVPTAQLAMYVRHADSIRALSSCVHTGTMPTADNFSQEVLGSMGSLGSEDGQMRDAADVAMDVEAGTVFVSDYSNRRVQVWNLASGTMERQWPMPDDGRPFGIEYVNGELFVADYDNSRVLVFDTVGNVQRQISRAGSEDGQLLAPFYLCVADNEVYVTDRSNNRISVFGVDGSFHRKWTHQDADDPTAKAMVPCGVFVVGPEVYVSDDKARRVLVFTRHGKFLSDFGARGSGPGQFESMYAVAVSDTAVFACDYHHGRVSVYDVRGRFVKDIVMDNKVHGLCLQDARTLLVSCRDSVKRLRLKW